MNKLEQWQKDRMKFYTESKALDFINEYFNVKRGARCIAGHIKDMYLLKKQPTYRIYGNNTCRSLTIPDKFTHKYNSLVEFWTVHSFMYTFNEKVLTQTPLPNGKNMMKESIEGINAVIEIDSPEEPDTETAKRTNFFDHIEQFNEIIYKLTKEIEESGQEYNLQFSGNGIYILLEGRYEDDIISYIQNFINFMDNKKENTEMGNTLKVHIDNKEAPWNDYFKIPFTFHEKRPRISMPLPKDELNKEWIDRVSNIDNIMNDFNIIDEIIKTSKWKKIW